MITQKKAANAIGGKTARACESCLTKRARWFCPADDAFLCQVCDSLVHSANELAGRHKRVRLGTASFKPVHYQTNTDDCTHSHKSTTPAWHQGFTKKARTPRHGAKRAKSAQENHALSNTKMMRVVPEMSGDEGSIEEENDEQMIFSVPTFEPFEVELENAMNNNEVNSVGLELEDDGFNIAFIGLQEEGRPDDWNDLPGFLPSDNNLAEFAADVENLLLEQGIDEDPMYSNLSLTNLEDTCERPFSINKNIENLETHEEIKVKDEDEDEAQDRTLVGGCLPGKWEVKIEEETESTTDCVHFDWSIDVASEILNFEVNNYGQSQEEETEEKKVEVITTREMGDNKDSNMQAKKRRKIFLRLNFEEVINAWAGSSPWITGCRPDFGPEHDGWPDSMGVVGHLGSHHQGGEAMREKGNVDGGDGNREARVSRYREKRRTRLFSKKIRYEVRKLNAEKRPRLKGRFVKRTSLGPVY